MNGWVIWLSLFIFGFLLSPYWINASPPGLNVEAVFITYGIATFSKAINPDGVWKFDSFVELADNYSSSHHFDWREYSSDHAPLLSNNPIVLSNLIRNINIETPVIWNKLEELTLNRFGIDQFNLKESGKIHICLKKFTSFLK